MNEQFERDKLCYEQNCEMFRSLNQIMWQVPLIAMTLTGGLWFGVSKIADHLSFRIALLILAAIGNFALCVVLWRVRYIMGEYLKVIRSFNHSGFVDARGVGALTRPKVVIRAFMAMLLTAGLISGAFALSAPRLLESEDDASTRTPTEKPAGQRDSD